jgi:hypothetical protein
MRPEMSVVVEIGNTVSAADSILTVVSVERDIAAIVSPLVHPQVSREGWEIIRSVSNETR